MERNTRLQVIFTSHIIYLSFYPSLRVPSKGAPSMFPNRVPMDSDTLSSEPLVYLLINSFTYVRRSPQKEPSYIHTYRKNIRSPYTEPHADGSPTYNRLRPGSPRESPTKLLFLPQCHASFSTILSTLAWVDQSPVNP